MPHQPGPGFQQGERGIMESLQQPLGQFVSPNIMQLLQKLDPRQLVPILQQMGIMQAPQPAQLTPQQMQQQQALPPIQAPADPQRSLVERIRARNALQDSMLRDLSK